MGVVAYCKSAFVQAYQRLLVPVGAFIISFGWVWYHVNRHEAWRFIGLTYLAWMGLYLGWQALRLLYLYLVQHYRASAFWQDQFLEFLNELFFLCSLWFGVFFLRNELVGLAYVVSIAFVVYFRTRQLLCRHPTPAPWLAAHTWFFTAGIFLFILNAAVQYAAYHYYILDANVKFYNIVVWRAAAMTALWMLGLALASFSYGRVRNRVIRFVPFAVYMFLFALFLVFWTVNVGILYYSGLYLSPVALEHASGASGAVFNPFFISVIGAAIVIFLLWLVILRFVIRAHTAENRHAFFWYQLTMAGSAIVLLFGLSSFGNTPEHAVLKSFHDYFSGNKKKVPLNSVVQKKLERFGLAYNPSAFYVAEKPFVFNPTSTVKLLPDRFYRAKPNIVIIFLESFSARLNGAYNSKLKGLTPGLEAFAGDPHTTVFKKYFNASTPTITGTLSQLCSLLPPTGHEEIQNERKLQSHHLLCLPELLKKEAGFKYAAYVTAVDKNYAHKDGIFTSMGVDKIFGTAELNEYIQGEPLSWGYSDHQLFPVIWQFMQTAPQPFLMMLATVDTHPPFNLAQDAVNYGDGGQPVLNMFHTTDDAFKQFWEQFKASSFYSNTVVITVADHAIFPGALTKDIRGWPESDDIKSAQTFYDQNTFLMYVPDSVLPKVVDEYASGLDITPTLLQMLNINIPNSFEGHSIFDDRKKYPNLLGMHELGLYINQIDSLGKRRIDYNIPSEISCTETVSPQDSRELTLCDYAHFYKWKRQMFEEGRFWKH